VSGPFCECLNVGDLKALVFLFAFEESVDCHLLSSFCDDSNLHISLFKYVLSTMGVSKESISKFLIGNRFHVKLRILSPYSNRILFLFYTYLIVGNLCAVPCVVATLWCAVGKSWCVVGTLRAVTALICFTGRLVIWTNLCFPLEREYDTAGPCASRSSIAHVHELHLSWSIFLVY